MNFEGIEKAIEMLTKDIDKLKDRQNQSWDSFQLQIETLEKRRAEHQVYLNNKRASQN